MVYEETVKLVANTNLIGQDEDKRDQQKAKQTYFLYQMLISKFFHFSTFQMLPSLTVHVTIKPVKNDSF